MLHLEHGTYTSNCQNRSVKKVEKSKAVKELDKTNSNHQTDRPRRRDVPMSCSSRWNIGIAPLTFLSHFAFAFAQLAQAITECVFGESIADTTTERGLNGAA